MSNQIYRMFHDPGHGWLEVPLADIPEGMHISQCSYIGWKNGERVVFLEEDCDAPRFCREVGRVDFNVRHYNDDQPSAIRTYESYEPA